MLVVASLLLTLASCSSNELDSKLEVTTPVNPSEVTVDGIDLKTIHPVAKKYYDLLKESIEVTDSHQPATRSAQSEFNPFIVKLENFKITENASATSFYALDENTRSQFLKEWSIIEAKAMSDKLMQSEDLVETVEEQNKVIEETLRAEVIYTRSGEAKVKDSKSFFTSINKKFEALYEKDKAEAEAAQAEVKTRGVIGKDHGPAFPITVLKKALVNHARRGDVILSLPNHNKPWVYANLGDNNFMIGHGAVLVNKVTEESPEDFPISLGCNIGEGVVYEAMNVWDVRCYILGFQRVAWDIENADGKWYKKRLRKMMTPVKNVDYMAEVVEKYIGRQYVSRNEFLTAKRYAPERFTCTSLVWHCAKVAYNINITPWWTPLVSPSAVYLDEATYIRANVNGK